jgi:hypothetical protein
VTTRAAEILAGPAGSFRQQVQIRGADLEGLVLTEWVATGSVANQTRTLGGNVSATDLAGRAELPRTPGRFPPGTARWRCRGELPRRDLDRKGPPCPPESARIGRSEPGDWEPAPLGACSASTPTCRRCDGDGEQGQREPARCARTPRSTASRSLDFFSRTAASRCPSTHQARSWLDGHTEFDASL